jgi:hypothetical protein
MADKPNVPVAVLFYALFGLGLVVFAVLPAGPAPGLWQDRGHGSAVADAHDPSKTVQAAKIRRARLPAVWSSRHLAARCGAVDASLGAALAMIHVVCTTLFCAPVANVSA